MAQAPDVRTKEEEESEAQIAAMAQSEGRVKRSAAMLLELDLTDFTSCPGGLREDYWTLYKQMHPVVTLRRDKATDPEPEPYLTHEQFTEVRVAAYMEYRKNKCDMNKLSDKAQRILKAFNGGAGPETIDEFINKQADLDKLAEARYAILRANIASYEKKLVEAGFAPDRTADDERNPHHYEKIKGYRAVNAAVDAYLYVHTENGILAKSPDPRLEKLASELSKIGNGDLLKALELAEGSDDMKKIKAKMKDPFDLNILPGLGVPVAPPVFASAQKPSNDVSL